MLIDWFTIIAQVINFLILVWLLKRFLYRPILHAIDAREKRIAAELADAAQQKAEAKQEREEFQQKNETIDKERNARLNQLTEETKKERTQILDTVRQEANDLRTKLDTALVNEQRILQEELTLQARDEVFAIARQALSDLAGTTLEQRMTEIFLQRLRELNDKDSQNLKSAFVSSTRPLLVRTAYKLPAEQREVIEAAIKETLGEDKQVQFETDSDLVSGIEMSADGQKIAWSIADYLASLSKRIESLLKTETKTKSEIKEKGTHENGA